MSSRNTGGYWIALAATVFGFSTLLYANTLQNEFVWDDRVLIVENETIRSFDLETLSGLFLTHFWSESKIFGSLYRPLVLVSYSIDYRIFGMNPLGFHLTNVVINGLSCVFVFVFVALLFGNRHLAIMTALIFASLPLHTESVAWISGRTDVLCMMWIMVSLIFYVLARRSGKGVFGNASLLAFGLAMLSKEVAVILPVVVAVIEFGVMEKARRNSAVSSAREKGGFVTIPWVLVSLFGAVLAGYWIVRWKAVGTGIDTYEPFVTGAVETLALSLSIFSGYCMKVLFPYRLNAEYDAPIPGGFFEPAVLTGLILLTALIVGAYRFRKRGEILLSVTFFIVPLLPVLNFVPITEISAERFLYVPSLGFALAVGTIFTDVLSRGAGTAGGSPPEKRTERKRPARDRRERTSAGRGPSLGLRKTVVLAVFAGLVGSYSWRTVARNLDWRNEVTLFGKTSRDEVGSARAHLNLGNALQREGRLEDAIREFNKSLAIDPNYAAAWSSLAGIYKERGELNRAVECISKSISIEPNNPQYYNSLGSLYARMGRYADASGQFRLALSLKPGDSGAQFNLALSSYLEGNFGEAKRLFLSLGDKDTKFVHSYYYLAALAWENGEIEDAREYARRFLSLYHADDSYSAHARKILGSPEN